MRDTRLWHPFADMATVRSAEFVVERGEDVWLWDDAGRRYLDATAGLWCANVGHGRRELREAIAAQLSRIETYQVFNDLATPPALALAERLAALAPVPDARVLLTSGGGDAIDTAAKLARAHHVARDEPDRVHLISREHGYHGTHGHGTSLAGIAVNRAGVGPLGPGVSVVAHDSVAALERELDRVGPHRVAAFFVEPVIGSGGVLPPPPGYLERVADVCRRAGVLLVADSVICAFGRLGDWFGVERWGLEPDMITFAKGVTSGYLPLGGVVVSGRVAAPFWDAPGRVFRHGPTYAGHATCCAAALANLDLLEADGLLARGRLLEGALHERLLELAGHPLVAEVRGGVGLLGGIELAPALLAAHPGATGALARAVRGHGVLVRPLVTSVAVSPPLTVRDEHLALIPAALRAGLDDLEAGLGAGAATLAGAAR
jgi:putrescine---pyruvate transaminase